MYVCMYVCMFNGIILNDRLGSLEERGKKSP